MVLPAALTPLPSMATACGIDALLVKSIVTVPALAASAFLSNFSAPDGSAARATVDPPPELELEPPLGVLVEPPLAPLPPEPELELLLPPQPARARIAAAARTPMSLVDIVLLLGRVRG